MIRMCVLFGLMFMLILAVGSCKAYMEVETIEGGNANLPFTTVGLTIFSEIDCVKGTEITRIGQYCGPDENCTTSLSTPFSIETGNLTIRNVTSNRCFRAQFIQGTRNNQTLYNVTINKSHSTISAEMSTTTFTTETPDYTSPDFYNNTASFRDVVFVVVVVVVIVVAAAAAVIVILVTIVLLAAQYKCKGYVNANTAAV